jgi:hypothetical protein
VVRGRLLRLALFSRPWGERGNTPATNTSDLRMDTIAEQGMPLRKTRCFFSIHPSALPASVAASWVDVDVLGL